MMINDSFSCSHLIRCRKFVLTDKSDGWSGEKAFGQGKVRDFCFLIIVGILLPPTNIVTLAVGNRREDKIVMMIVDD